MAAPREAATTLGPFQVWRQGRAEGPGTLALLPASSFRIPPHRGCNFVGAQSGTLRGADVRLLQDGDGRAMVLSSARRLGTSPSLYDV